MNQDRTWDDLCQLYLSGELNAAEQEAFEAETFTSSERLAEFNRQANLITLAGEASPNAGHTSQQRDAGAWTLVKAGSALAALAASAMLIFSIVNRQPDVQVSSRQNASDSQPDIAEVWAATHQSLDFGDFEIQESEEDSIAEDSSGEELPSWLVLGVAEAAMLEEAGAGFDG